MHFDLPVEHGGWPPVTVESLRAEPVGDDVVRLSGPPRFAFGVSSGDLIRVERDADGRHWATELVAWSGRCTIRVVPFGSGPLRGSLQRVLDAFELFGVCGEGIQQYGIVTLDVPADADLTGVQRVLRTGARDGWWDYEEGCVGDAWLAAAPG
ncbi:DUF4265 domain-containing protein [Actinoplanes utahensis]|uniref:DUF4265 domain-containing protein n=1 Tax=Actinoplanes utahensis TaxID=1869 RepID=UPI00194E87A0|nr:DUF4265 domain-containing protein [Actinoplanes utahensis]